MAQKFTKYAQLILLLCPDGLATPRKSSQKTAVDEFTKTAQMKLEEIIRCESESEASICPDNSLFENLKGQLDRAKYCAPNINEHGILFY
jgi:hypothetical protein